MASTGRHAKLTEGPIRRHLTDMAVPIMWGILSTVAFNAADTYFVGRLGTGPLAAISFTFPVIMVVLNLSVGLGAGVSSILARTIGAGDEGAMRRLATDALLLALIISLVLTGLGLATTEPLFRLLGAEPELVPDIRAYMVIWYPGVVFLVGSMCVISILRAVGETRIPGYLMVGASILNIVIDPLLIFGLFGFPRLEIAGAAVATVLSRGLLLVLLLRILVRRELLDLTRLGVGPILISWRRILHVGLPAAATNMIIPLAMGVIVALVASFGSDAVAGFGVASRVEAIALVTYYALSAVIGPVVGQNLGAGRRDRVREAITVSLFFCFASGAVFALVLGLAAAPIASLFSGEPRVIEAARDYLWIVPLSYGGAGAVMVCNAAFNGLGQPGRAVLISAARMLLLHLPMAYLAAAFVGLNGVFVAGSLANLLAGIGACLWMRRVCRTWQVEGGAERSGATARPGGPSV
jgi:putative MATE family efflux protein